MMQSRKTIRQRSDAQSAVDRRGRGGSERASRATEYFLRGQARAMVEIRGLRGCWRGTCSCFRQFMHRGSRPASDAGPARVAGLLRRHVGAPRQLSRPRAASPRHRPRSADRPRLCCSAAHAQAPGRAAASPGSCKAPPGRACSSCASTSAATWTAIEHVADLLVACAAAPRPAGRAASAPPRMH